MAETIAGPFVSFVVKRLGEVLIQEANFLRGISSQVEEMQMELNRMQCFLKDAAAKQEGDKKVHNWVAEIREAAYDADEVIDKFIIKVAFKKETGTGILNVLVRYSCVFKNSISIHKVGVEIKSIKTKIASIRTSLETYGVSAIHEGESSSSEKQRLLRQSYPHIVEDIVGLDDDLKIIAEHLVKEERQCRVVSIWGMGGLGKTTLAKKVYNQSDVRRHFDSFAWTFISQQCNTREVLEDILIGLTSPSLDERKKIKIMNHGELVAELFQFQSQKKCLVVIDDIWKAQDWEILSPAFPNKKDTGSKILLTTRIEEVASYADQQHNLRHLTEDESWKLFEKKASTEFELSTKMMELGKEMVKQCGGLPLAIVVLGGLLANKHKMEEWETVSRNISYYLNKKGKGGHGGVPVSDILALSYQDLPYHLKACFLYLSHLPEDYDIPATKLVQIWMAEGIVSSSSVKETMLDVGMSYLGELAQRCMVQVQLTRFSRKIKFCRLHDLMRDLCLLKAQEENFLKVVRVEAFDNQQLKWENSASSSSLSPLTTTRRLAVYYLGDHDVDSIRQEYINLHELTNHHHLRSCQFYSFGNYLETFGWKQIKSLLKCFKLLRILDVERMKLKGKYRMLPRDVGNLFHLRYLNIKDSTIRSVPSSIGNLRFLQTLDLRVDEYASLEIPNVLWRLEQLRHLYLPRTIKLTGTSKLRLDGLSKLETLEAFDTEFCDVRYFPKLTNLQEVEICCVSPEDLAVILKSPFLLNNSSSLLLPSSSIKIEGDFRTEEEQSLLRQLLGCHNLGKFYLWGSLNVVNKLLDQFHPNLTDLLLEKTKLEEDPMPTLEKLPNLRHLSLCDDAYIGKEMVCSSAPLTTTAPSSSSGGGRGGYGGCDGGGFPKLRSLHLWNIENLEDWRVEQGAMACLVRLEIGGCKKLKEIPDGLRFITTLQELVIRHAYEALKCRVREGGEDFYKVKHVPSIILRFDDRSFSDLPTFTSD